MVNTGGGVYSSSIAFTLIELLAVIVILAVIALIAVSITLNIIDKARRNSFKSSLMSMFRADELYEAGVTSLNISNLDKNAKYNFVVVGYAGNGSITFDKLWLEK